MSDWHKYYDLEPIRRLHFEGRELIGEYISITEKRDGENVSLSLITEEKPFAGKISSHNQEIAAKDIITRFIATPEYGKAFQLLMDETNYQNHYILYGELMKKVCPTRIEPNKKHCHWVLFDIYDLVQKKYLCYNEVYQKSYHYKIPIVKQLDVFIPASVEEISLKVEEWLVWCRRHHREGIVGKAYRNQVFFKEKIDLPEKIKIVKPSRVQYPPMPPEKELRCLQHAFDVVTEANWKDAKIAMPIVAQQFAVEAREHYYSVPRNIYSLWVNTPIEKVKPHVE